MMHSIMWSCETSNSSSKIENTVQLFSTSTKSEQLFGPCCLIVNRETVMLSYVHSLFIDSHCMKHTEIIILETFLQPTLFFNKIAENWQIHSQQELVALNSRRWWHLLQIPNSAQFFFFYKQASLFRKKSSLLRECGPNLQFLTLQTSHSIYFRWHSFFQGHHSQILTETLALVSVWSLLYMHQPNQYLHSLMSSMARNPTPTFPLASNIIIWQQNIISPTFLPFSPPPSPGLRRAGLPGWGPGLLYPSSCSRAWKLFWINASSIVSCKSI